MPLILHVNEEAKRSVIKGEKRVKRRIRYFGQIAKEFCSLKVSPKQDIIMTYMTL